MFNITAYHALKKVIPSTVMLVAVTKNKSAEDINSALDAGIEIIGESYLQEALEKYPLIKEKLRKHCAEFHFIGRIQSNKISKICQHFDCIQSISSLKHAQKINETCRLLSKKMNYFIQINGDETQKSGTNYDTAFELYNQLQQFSQLKFRGFMCIPPQGKEQQWFEKMYQLKQEFNSKNIFCELSMGMSEDYLDAIAHGATMIRIGSLLFGKRDS